MQLTDGISDAIEIANDLHRQVHELERSIDELQYLIYSLDDRVKIEFFKECSRTTSAKDN